MKTLCIYHKNCADGFGAAWVVRKALGEENVEFHAASYGDEPPDVKGRDVLIVDFSYSLERLKAMSAVAYSIVILDHHKSAAEDLSTLTFEGGNVANQHNLWEKVNLFDICTGLVAIFDMERSGAMLAWDFFFPNEDTPPLIAHIEDRDLWRFRYVDTKAVTARIFVEDYDFEVWDKLMSENPASLADEGNILLRKQARDVASLVEKQYTMDIAGFEVPVVNAPYMFASDIGHILAQDAPFAATYYYDGDKTHFSLRSRNEGGEDVSAIAKQFGGGGHRNAAGFEISMTSDNFMLLPSYPLNSFDLEANQERS